jgi:autotransporter translocation and assembly factor TamB
VHLGNSVWIQKGREIKVQLAGDVLARIAGKTTLEGRLDLKGGKLDVSGKRFDIESGVVTFDGGDPGNPSIVATARWDSPTEYRVYAEYTGTVKDGKLKLRSDPPLSSDKVLRRRPEIMEPEVHGNPMETTILLSLSHGTCRRLAG